MTIVDTLMLLVGCVLLYMIGPYTRWLSYKFHIGKNEATLHTLRKDVEHYGNDTDQEEDEYSQKHQGQR